MLRCELSCCPMTDTLPKHSQFPMLEPVLSGVSKPIQYVGGEHNSVVKEWDEIEVRWCLCYPDAYEVGQPNQGVAILYEILNEQDWILAERTYAVWPDMAATMREASITQFTLDAHRPVALFDLIGFSFSTELGYTNMLSVLDLAECPSWRSTAMKAILWWSLGGMRRSIPSPLRTLLTSLCSVTAKRPAC